MSVKDVLVRASASRPKPTLSLSAKDLPAIKEWKVGGKYCIVLDVEQISASKGDGYGDDDSKDLNARFKVLKAHEQDDDEYKD